MQFTFVKETNFQLFLFTIIMLHSLFVWGFFNLIIIMLHSVVLYLLFLQWSLEFFYTLLVKKKCDYNFFFWFALWREYIFKDFIYLTYQERGSVWHWLSTPCQPHTLTSIIFNKPRGPTILRSDLYEGGYAAMLYIWE